MKPRSGRIVAALVLLGAACRDATPVATAACPASPFRNSPPLVIAHAGGEGLGPANSILAMHRSMDAGADILDVDLWMSADGVIVAHHDRVVTSIARNIDETPIADLGAVDLRDQWTGEAISEPVPIPTLDEILGEFTDVMISLEIKQAQPSMATELCALLVQHDAVDRVYLSANEDEAVYAAQAECPDSTVITTTYRDVAEMRTARETGGAWCAPAPIGQPPFRESLLDPDNVAWSHDHGMAIFTWTIDDPDTLRGLAEAGVDGVYTRRPDIARQIFDEVAAD